MTDDGIMYPACRGNGQVVGETDRVLCRPCGGTGEHRDQEVVAIFEAAKARVSTWIKDTSERLATETHMRPYK